MKAKKYTYEIFKCDVQDEKTQIYKTIWWAYVYLNRRVKTRDFDTKEKLKKNIQELGEALKCEISEVKK